MCVKNSTMPIKLIFKTNFAGFIKQKYVINFDNDIFNLSLFNY
jgi:hypothetical protein